MAITNYYVHCDQEWFEDECDSFHNSRCPHCNKEIEPIRSEVFDNFTGDLTDEVDHGPVYSEKEWAEHLTTLNNDGTMPTSE